MRDRVGICQWFHFEAYEDIERSIELLADLGVRHLRTGISWADFHRPAGRRWYDWQMARLAEAGLEVLLSVWHTPPSIAAGGHPASPPRDLGAYADFIDLLIDLYGRKFDALELWNEPNNGYKWDFGAHDPGWAKFGQMVGQAGYWAKQRGKTTVLGGMAPVDPHWLALMRDYGVLEWIDVVAIHAFPGMWWPGGRNWEWYSHWRGWQHKVGLIADLAAGRPIWVSETGLATCNLEGRCTDKYRLQAQKLGEALEAPAERVYWYSLIDLHPDRDALEGFHIDENEYHLGLVTADGVRKPAYDRLKRALAEPLRAAG
jgi:CDP-paratose 2-epimerase